MSKIGIGIGEDFPVDAPLCPGVDAEATEDRPNGPRFGHRFGRGHGRGFAHRGHGRGDDYEPEVLRARVQSHFVMLFALATIVLVVLGRR